MKRDMYAFGEWWVPIYATQVSEKHVYQQGAWSRGNVVNSSNGHYILIYTPMGPDKAFAGDWIIQVQNLYYVLTDEVFKNAFIKWDARAGGNTDNQEWPKAPRQLMTKRKEKQSHGAVIRNPRTS